MYIDNIHIHTCMYLCICIYIYIYVYSYAYVNNIKYHFLCDKHGYLVATQRFRPRSAIKGHTILNQ